LPEDEIGVEVAEQVEEQPATRSVNGKAITSLILGIIGMTGVLFVAAIVAIVLGRRAKTEIESSDQRGSALAAAGIVLGWIGVAVFALLFVLGATEIL
jgi:hypothetical protein